MSLKSLSSLNFCALALPGDFPQALAGYGMQSRRLLLCVSLISPRLLALKGRQITDGGKQRAAPGYGKLITPPPCADGAREGVRGRVWHGDGGHASLTPVCALSPLQGVFAKGGVVACWWVLCEKAVCEGTKGQKRPRDFCVLFPYLSLFCLSGARRQRPVGILGGYAPECVTLGKRNA